MIVTRCAFANCPIKVTDHKYCSQHVFKMVRPKDRRESAAKRGYDHKWTKYRKLYLMENPICVRCESLGVVVEATVIDHIKPVENGQHDPLFWVKTNHQSLCRSCHSWKTRVIDRKGYGVSQGRASKLARPNRR
jgi:5-methylcytosine-specific restriction endonuclease McrA